MLDCRKIALWTVLFTGVAGAQTLTGWKQVWADEFNGKELDFNKWSVEENGNGGGNNELQYYVDRPENVRVEGGNLVIEARKEKYSGGGIEKNFTSGRIRTKRHASWTYGRYEIRAKLPTGRGIWPALWMLPENDKYGGWAASGEIDIMELLGQEPDKAYGTLHYGGAWPKNVHTGEPFKLEKGSFADDFHVFALEWEKGAIRWYVDGKLYQTQTKWESAGGPFPAPFDQPFFFVINLAVGGGWPGPPDDSTVFPQKLLVDYVRVYQRH
jgi:beta-glucanase (GH16 family)